MGSRPSHSGQQRGITRDSQTRLKLTACFFRVADFEQRNTVSLTRGQTIWEYIHHVFIEAHISTPNVVVTVT